MFVVVHISVAGRVETQAVCERTGCQAVSKRPKNLVRLHTVYSPFFLSRDLIPRYTPKTTRDYGMNFSKRLLDLKKRTFA